MALDISSPLPTVGGDLGTWGTELNTAITEIINEAGKDSDIVSLQSTKVDKTNPVLDGTATGTSITTIGEADKLIKVNSSGRVILGGVDDGINKLQINGNAKFSGLAGTGNRMLVADASGNMSASGMAYTENSYTPILSSTGQTGSWTYGVQSGKYIRIGNKLTIFLSIGWTSKPSAGTGIKISLPAQANVNTLRGFLGEYSGITFTGKQLTLSNSGADSGNIYLFQNSSGGGPTGINVSDIGSSGSLVCVIETLAI